VGIGCAAAREESFAETATAARRFAHDNKLLIGYQSFSTGLTPLI